MAQTDFFSKSEQKLLDRLLTYTTAERELATGRGQLWPGLLGAFQKLLQQYNTLTTVLAQSRYFGGALRLAGTGCLSEVQITGADLLSDNQKQQCLELRAIYFRQHRHQMSQVQPVAGQRITAKFKPDTYLGKYGSWHTGTVTVDPSGLGFSIPGTGVSLSDISEWMAAPDEEPHDVEKREYFEEYAREHPEYLTR